MSEWQPIETAPKDGSPTILFGETFGEWKMYLGSWVESPLHQMVLVENNAQRVVYEWQITSDGYWTSTPGRDFHPTHWMPAPEKLPSA